MTDLEKLMSQVASTLDRFRLDGKAALVVGGNKGLGQAMALALAAAGADVCIAARGPVGLEETAEAITKFRRVGKHISADVTQEEQVEKMIAACSTFLGRLISWSIARGWSIFNLSPSLTQRPGKVLSMLI